MEREDRLRVMAIEIGIGSAKVESAGEYGGRGLKGKLLRGIDRPAGRMGRSNDLIFKK